MTSPSAKSRRPLVLWLEDDGDTCDLYRDVLCVEVPELDLRFTRTIASFIKEFVVHECCGCVLDVMLEEELRFFSGLRNVKIIRGCRHD